MVNSVLEHAAKYKKNKLNIPIAHGTISTLLPKIRNLTSWENTQPQMLTQRRKMNIQNFLNIQNI